MRLRALVRCYVGRAKGICQVSGGVCERATAAPLSSCARPPTHAGARPAQELLSHRPARELLSAVLHAVQHLGASPSASAARATRASVGARGCLARRPTSIPPPGGFPPTFCELMETWRSSKVKRGLLDATPPPPLPCARRRRLTAEQAEAGPRLRPPAAPAALPWCRPRAAPSPGTRP